MPVLLVYAGLLVVVAGFVSLLRPISFVGIRKRRTGLVVLVLGMGIAVAGVMWPASLHRAPGPRRRIDEFVPAYQFNEVHSTRIHAPPARVFGAIRSVTPGEIRFFETLMAIRELPSRLLGEGRAPAPIHGYRVEAMERKSLDAHDFTLESGMKKRVAGRRKTIDYVLETGGKPTPAAEILRLHEEAIGRMGGSAVGRAGCCRSTMKLGAEGTEVWVEVDASPDGAGYRLTIVGSGEARSASTHPLLDLLTRSGFLVLADDPDREIVLGNLMQFSTSPGGAPASRITDPPGFRAFDAPGFAKVAANFIVEDVGGGWCRVTTETRIFTTDPPSRRAFAAYWRVIYPGSATIRRTWLMAIKRRAEGSPGGADAGVRLR